MLCSYALGPDELGYMSTLFSFIPILGWTLIPSLLEKAIMAFTSVNVGFSYVLVKFLIYASM